VIERIIKRNGEVEDFSPRKLNGWGEWASKTLGNHVDWSEVVLHVVSTLPQDVTSEQLQQALIDHCLTKATWSYNRMAGRLYAALLYKKLYNGKIPTVKELFSKLVSVGLMDVNFFEAFSDDDYVQLESIIDHKRDLNYAHYQIEQSVKKYALKNRADNVDYETPQFSMLRVAMRMCMNKGVGEARIARIKRHYDQYSKDKVNVPTPYYTNSGTVKNGFQSCCLHHTNNTVGSLAASDHISYMMTVSSAGQGSKIYTQSIGSPVRGGSIVHQGKTPYYRAQVAMINANLQNGRGGAETQSYDVYDPEIETIQKFKNPMTPTARQVRGLDYAMCFNKFFAQKAANNEDYALFDFKDTEDLYKAMANPDTNVFEGLYNNYIALGKAVRFVNAREVLYNALSESVETGRHYLSNLSEMNRHTPFKSLILLSNLCQEIALETKAYDSVEQLYKEEESGEVAMCSLAGINVGRINSDEEYKEATWVALDMIHTGIKESDYVLPQIGFTAKKRMSAGVGIVDLAYAMAKRKLKYSSQEGRNFIHELAETHYWYLLESSLKLSEEFGNAEWIDRTKWVDGWLPTDTYNKHIDEVVSVENKRDWESMRKRIIENKGHAFSVLAAHMPAESSSIKSGATNSVYPVRDLDLSKSNDTNVVTYVVPESEKFGKHYEIAWDIDVEDMAKVYGIIQKWTDQAISADMWYSAVGSDKISSDDLMRGFFSWVYYGVKTRYYVNTKTAKGIDLNSSEVVQSSEDIEFQPESNSDCAGCQL
jgi:ribonucleoside-diphosphate reductase alpha chain